jgi:CheY-like chemotaxis protein
VIYNDKVVKISSGILQMSVLASRGTLSILIVEDDLLLGAGVAAVLEDLKFSVVGIATTAAEARSIAQICRPSLALIDRRLAGNPLWEDLYRTLSRLRIPTLMIGEASSDATDSAARPEEAKGVPAARGPVGTPFRPSEMFNELMLVAIDVAG